MPILLNVYCTVRNPPAPQFPHVSISRRGREDAELQPDLQSFTGYVLSRGGEQMTAIKYRLMRHIQRVRHHFSMEIEAGDLKALGRWAQAANAILYAPDGSVRDCHGRVLLGAEGQTQEGASVPYPEDAQARKARTNRRLQELGIRVPEALPPVIGETEVDLRPASEAACRAMALFLVAVRAEVIAQARGPSAAELKDRLPLAAVSVSPAEAAFLEALEPDEAQVPVFSWRYESALALQWALGMVPDLPFPTVVCDVPALARRMFEANADRFAGDAVLRPAGEILDALDLHYRLHWAVRQARLDKKPAANGIDGSVVYERHYAFNWLVRFEDAEWDAVDTAT